MEGCTTEGLIFTRIRTIPISWYRISGDTNGIGTRTPLYSHVILVYYIVPGQVLSHPFPSPTNTTWTVVYVVLQPWQAGLTGVPLCCIHHWPQSTAVVLCIYCSPDATQRRDDVTWQSHDVVWWCHVTSSLLGIITPVVSGIINTDGIVSDTNFY